MQCDLISPVTLIKRKKASRSLSIRFRCFCCRGPLPRVVFGAPFITKKASRALDDTATPFRNPYSLALTRKSLETRKHLAQGWPSVCSLPRLTICMPFCLLPALPLRSPATRNDGCSL